MEPENAPAEPTAPDTQHQTPNTKYEEGVAHFNRGEYFEAHEVWEDWWAECPAAERRFAQALIQAAVAVYHFNRGNYSGASRLFHSGRRYMQPYCPAYLGLDVDEFWRTMEAHLAPALSGGASGPRPVIALPSPAGPS